MGPYRSNNHSLGIDLKPLSPSKDVMLTIVVRAFTLATVANRGLSVFKIHRTVVLRGNNNLSFAIRETIFFISHDSNQSVVE